MNIRCYAWKNKDNILFDYHSRDYARTDFSVKSDCFLTTIDKKILFTSNMEDLEGREYIASIRKEGEKYFINNDEENRNSNFEKNLADKLWIVVGNTKFKNDLGYRLRQGDKIKFGRIILKVCELNYEGEESSQHSNKEKSTFYIPAKNILYNTNGLNIENSNYVSYITKKDDQKFKITCRICLGEENEDNNPLISPCKCIGSVRFTHLTCFQKWLNAKTITKKFKNLTVYTFKDFECELCKSAIPGKYKSL